jgi:diaminopimelate decarboxylase
MGAYINLDDSTHVEFLERICEGNVPETVCLRFNPGGSFSLGNTIMDMPRDAKYGMTEDQMAGAFLRLSKLGCKHFGIHAFLASNTVSNEYYPELAAQLFRLAVRLKNATGVHISFINLSGGVGVDYRPEQPSNNIALIGDGVRRQFENILVPAGMGDVAIFTELGRFMLAPYGHLISTVLHKKHIYKEYVGLDACAANLMRPAMYGAYHHITVLGKEDEILDHVYDVTGGLCENNDKFAIERSLPAIDIGDILVIHDTGAHGHAMGYNYNGKLRSAEVLLQEDGSFKLIRRAETPADYFATLDFTGLNLQD